MTYAMRAEAELRQLPIDHTSSLALALKVRKLAVAFCAMSSIVHINFGGRMRQVTMRWGGGGGKRGVSAHGKGPVNRLHKQCQCLLYDISYLCE